MSIAERATAAASRHRLTVRLKGSNRIRRPDTATPRIFAIAIPALAALALVSSVCSLVVAYEAIRYREPRTTVRHPDLPA